MKNVVITGASDGIGKAIAILFANNGYNIHLSSRNVKKLQILKNEILKPNINIHILSVDLSIKEEVKKLADDIKYKFEKIDILINNVGQFIPSNFVDEQEGDLEKMININLYSAYYLTKYLLPTMLQNNDGHIFNICSIASLQAYKNGGSYSISKYALLGFTENLREELKQTNIKVTAVCPGATYSNSWASSNIDKTSIMESIDIAKIILCSSNLSKQAVVENIILRPQKGDL